MARENIAIPLDPDDHREFTDFRDGLDVTNAEAGRRLIRAGLERKQSGETATDGGYVAQSRPTRPDSLLYQIGLGVLAAGFLLLGMNLFISPGPQVYAMVVLLGGGACVLIAEIFERYGGGE